MADDWRLVYERFDWACAGCGLDVTFLQWRSIQHRKARGVGGTNALSNRIALCGSATSQGCHLLCEQRSPEMMARGLVVPSHEDPAQVPVVLWTGRRVYLDDEGGVRDAD
jgi:hypothetical protein